MIGIYIVLNLYLLIQISFLTSQTLVFYHLLVFLQIVLDVYKRQAVDMFLGIDADALHYLLDEFAAQLQRSDAEVYKRQVKNEE